MESTAEVVTVQESQIVALRDEGAGLADQARAMIVITAQDRQAAADFRVHLYATDKRIEGVFRDPKIKAHEAHKERK